MPRWSRNRRSGREADLLFDRLSRHRPRSPRLVTDAPLARKRPKEEAIRSVISGLRSTGQPVPAPCSSNLPPHLRPEARDPSPRHAQHDRTSALPIARRITPPLHARIPDGLGFLELLPVTGRVSDVSIASRCCSALDSPGLSQDHTASSVDHVKQLANALKPHVPTNHVARLAGTSLTHVCSQGWHKL